MSTLKKIFPLWNLKKSKLCVAYCFILNVQNKLYIVIERSYFEILFNVNNNINNNKQILYISYCAKFMFIFVEDISVKE